MHFSFFKRNAKWILALALFSLLATCFKAPPSNEELELLFKPNVSAAENLKQMILEDATSHNKEIYRIGIDRVGEYSKGLIKWSVIGTKQKLSLKDALQAEGLNESRFNSYISLLNQLHAERISVFSNEMNNKRVVISIFSQGLSISGCGMNFSYIYPAPTNRNTKGDDSFEEYIPLGNDWYIENFSCNN